jgi:hypothetical protein
VAAAGEQLEARKVEPDGVEDSSFTGPCAGEKIATLTFLHAVSASCVVVVSLNKVFSFCGLLTWQRVLTRPQNPRGSSFTLYVRTHIGIIISS